MAKLPVKLLTIFASSVAPTGNVAQPGSTKAGSTVYSGDPATLQGLAAWAAGLPSQLIDTSGGVNSQVLEELNGILYVLTYQLAYLKQAGIAEWDASVTYYIGSWVNVAGVPYLSKTDNNLNNDPLGGGGPTNWQTYASTLLGASDPLIKAWVNFDGRTGAIDSAFNVSSVTRVSAGKYLVNFAAAMTNDLYGFSGTANTRPGTGWLPGDDNLIVGGMSGQVPVRTVNQCSVYCYDRGDQASQDSGLISLQFFGP